MSQTADSPHADFRLWPAGCTLQRAVRRLLRRSQDVGLRRDRGYSQTPVHARCARGSALAGTRQFKPANPV